MPTVSVIMPVYNGARFLAPAIHSVLSQTYPDWELLVIDDGSQDDSRAIAAGFDDPRIRVLVNGVNRGLVHTRNRGLDEAAGRYVAFLDSDDIARPQRLEKQIHHLEHHPELGGVGTWVQPIDSEGRATPHIWKHPGSAAITRSILLFRGQFLTSSFTCRAELARRLRFSSTAPLAEDYDLYVRMARESLLCNLSEVLVDYRIHGNNVTTTRRHALRDSLNGIANSQLALLGIAPTEQDLLIHRHLEWMDQPDTPALLDAVEAWLQRILAANRVIEAYPPGLLAQAAAERWFRICEHAAALGVGGALWRCYRSPLARGLREPLADQCKFVAKCVLRRAPRLRIAS